MRSRTDSFFGKEVRKQEREYRLEQVNLSVSAMGSLNFSVVFILKQYAMEVLANFGQTLLFPFAAAGSLFSAAFALYQARKDGYQRSGVINALVETVAALALTTAVVGGFFAATLFAVLAPWIFFIVSAAKTLYLGISTGYYAVRALLTSEPHEKQKYYDLALGAAMGVAINALATVALGLVMIAGHLPLSILGIIAGSCGALYALYQGLTLKKPGRAALTPLSSTGRFHQGLGTQPQPPLSAAELQLEDSAGFAQPTGTPVNSQEEQVPDENSIPARVPTVTPMPHSLSRM